MTAAQLDHVSLPVRDPAAWAAMLGFAPPRASRIHLAGSYLEVAPQVERPLLFLRPDDLSAAADALRVAGFTPRGPTPYAGHDGTWLDVQVEELPFLALTRRTDRDDWPPPDGDPHPNRATRLRAVHLTGDPATLDRLTDALDLRGVLVLVDAREGEPLRLAAADCGGGVVVPLS